MQENDFIFLQKSHTVHLKPDGGVCNRLKAGTKICLLQIKGEWTNISWRNGKKRDGLNFSQKNLTGYKQATMKIDYNKKVLIGVALVLYIFYKMMGG